jgi:SAM-dependent methyltransferase
VKGSDDIGKSDEKVDAILANESAFHYPDRARYFKRCCDSLKEGGTLVMTDLVANDEMKVNCFMYWFWKWYMRFTLEFPANTAYTNFDKYKENLKAAGFSKVEVVDITNIAIRPFYVQMTEIVKIPTAHTTIWISMFWEINKSINRLLSSNDPTQFPMKYSLVVCTK